MRSGTTAETVWSLATGLASTLLYGLAISMNWGWFVAGPFGLPPISVAQGYGISILVGLLVPHLTRYKDHEVQEMTMGGLRLLYPVVATAIGWLTHALFMA